MKKLIIITAIILTSGLAAFAFTTDKPSVNTTTPVQNEVTKAKAHDGDTRLNLATAD